VANNNEKSTNTNINKKTNNPITDFGGFNFSEDINLSDDFNNNNNNNHD
jgi:hypothetical protein